MPLAGPPLSDALLQRLKGICAEMRSDSFWRDLASPIQAALNALRDEAESFDSISAKEYRKSALQSLEGAATQLSEAAKNNLFVAELEVVRAALAQLKGEDGKEAGAEQAALTQLDSSAAARVEMQASSEQTAVMKALQAKQAADKGVAPPAPVKTAPASGPIAFVAPSPPFNWEQDDDGCVSVSVAVPAETEKKDVSVTFKPKHLIVSIRGHPSTPVIDSDLLYVVQSDSCSWGLEGSGAKRRLCINLEKVDAGETWGALLDDELGRRNKEIASMASGMGLEQWTSAHTS